VNRGFQLIDILSENLNEGPPSQQDLQQWANWAGMSTIPVLSDPSSNATFVFEWDGYIPTTVHIGPDMTVLSVDQSIHNPGRWL
jgi:hypothetical protein